MPRPPSGYYFRDGYYTDVGGRRRLLVRGPQGDDFVFVTIRRRPWARSSIQQAFRRLREELGLPQDLTVYGYRHRLGTESIQQGNSLRITADIMGHKNIRTTERYVHPALKAEHLAAAMARAARSGECA